MHQGRSTRRPYQSADGSPAQGGSSRRIQTERKTPLTGQLHGSRICNGQSTKEPQGSTGTDQHEVGYSIKITYFHPISIDFHKRRDLFWDRWSHLHNFHQLNGLQNGRRGNLSAFLIPLGTPFGGSPKFTSGCFSRAATGTNISNFCGNLEIIEVPPPCMVAAGIFDCTPQQAEWSFSGSAAPREWLDTKQLDLT